jgi:Zn-dependent M28 family amino/carboxypeptidase
MTVTASRTTADEKGLYGGQYFADHPTVPRDSIVARVNMDQRGRGEPIDNRRRRT